jgi:hypothetical protein
MRRLAPLALLLAGAHALACTAETGATAPAVVELYTSEGCSSCPPADRWLSTLKGRPDVLAVAFHVNYWDHLGWQDRFATPDGTQRQRALAAAAGRPSVYTPQVRLNGVDVRPGAALPPPQPSPVRVALVRDGQQVRAEVAALSSAGRRLTGWWAVLEDGHGSRVRAGENAGETLQHDHVVRLYRPVAEWNAAEGLKTSLALPPATPGHARRIAFVVADPVTQRPVQGVALGC